MPETAIQKTLAKEQYLKQDRSVKIHDYLEKQKKLEESGLKDIEVRKTAKQLGKDDFLQLLITQLTHQDPTAPVKDQAFIAQMAQFSSLEQMKNMAGTLHKMSERQAQGLVGKFVIGKDHLTGAQVSGVARAMFYDKSGDAFFKVGGSVVRVNDITLIGNPEDFKPEYGGTAPVKKSPVSPVGTPPGRIGVPAPKANAPVPNAEVSTQGKQGSQVSKKADVTPPAHTRRNIETPASGAQKGSLGEMYERQSHKVPEAKANKKGDQRIDIRK